MVLMLRLVARLRVVGGQPLQRVNERKPMRNKQMDISLLSTAVLNMFISDVRVNLAACKRENIILVSLFMHCNGGSVWSIITRSKCATLRCQRG